MEVFWSFISFENKMVSEYLDGVIQKQPNDDLRKRCSKNMEQIYRFSKHLFLKTALGNCFWVIGWMRSKLTLKTLKWRQTILVSCFYYEWFQLIQHSNRNSCPEVLCNKGILKTFGKFTGNQLYQSLFFLIKLQAWGQQLY